MSETDDAGRCPYCDCRACECGGSNLFEHWDELDHPDEED